jgi:adenine-specific DNA-methyltransferase
VIGFKFCRQHPIGRYIVDFCCRERYLVVELDGGHHSNHTQADQRRTECLNHLGYLVLRFWDHEVLTDLDAVLQRIADVAGNSSPHPGLPP